MMHGNAAYSRTEEGLMLTHIILYVKDQALSADFYAFVLDMQPSLNVPGMTEFKLSETCVLGLMPEDGIKRLLGSNLPDPATAGGVPRAEVYMIIKDARSYHARALQKGAIELSGLALRNWGQVVAYSLDRDGHVLAFAELSASG